MLAKTILIAGVSLVAASASAQTSVPAKAASRAAAATVVTITARDFAFDAPKRIAAGLVTFRLMNHGKEPHHAQLLRFSGKQTVKQYVKALKPNAPPPAWATSVGGPNAVDPHGHSEVTQLLRPGNYAIVCFVDTPDHVPHVMKGMSKDIIVTPKKAVAALPSGDATLSLVDYNFIFSKPLVAGHQRLTVTTNAEQPHELTVFKLAPGMTAKNLLEWFDKMQGPPPASVLGGVAGLAKGIPVSVPLDLTPGNYLLICFLPDPKDGKPHFMHGMMQEVTVK